MDQNTIDNAIYEKYITPTKLKSKKFIGIEIEMPVVNLKKEPVEEKVIFKLSKAFCERFGFNVIGRDSIGNANSMQDDKTGDNLSFDCCYSNLELSLGKGDNLHQIKERFDKYYTFINDFLSDYNYTLTGMGINPYYDINHNKPIENERYRMLYHHLHSYPKYEGNGFAFHHFPSFGTFTSASQVQIDIFHEDLIPVINTFGRLEPFKSLLFSNSLLPEEADLLCARNMLWERSMQGYNPHNIGMFEYELKDCDDLVEYIKSTSIYCTMRDGKYINFTPVPINEYLKLDSVQGEYFDGTGYKDIEFEPCLEDIDHLRTFKFVDLTYRGTIEFRSMCTQPIADSMSIAAFHIGLLERVSELQGLLNSDNVIYAHGYSASELQRMFARKELPDFVDKEKLTKTLLRILELSESGLKQRNMNEEIFLEPLYERARTLSNPAKNMLEGIENGASLEYYIKEYSLLKR
ncbi:MAG: glutamylcysteine synthetase [Oscillospiraceae bacterium]|nr:glutamylcysteine synthetase [Oscillospiraceae bacterium]